MGCAWVGEVGWLGPNLAPTPEMCSAATRALQPGWQKFLGLKITRHSVHIWREVNKALRLDGVVESWLEGGRR